MAGHGTIPWGLPLPIPATGVDMPRPCSICADLRRNEIDLRLAKQVVNVRALAAEFDVGREALRSHRRKHLPEFLAAFSSTASAPVVGSLMAEYQRLYLTALDELARAQAGTLVDIGDDGVEHRRISSTAIAKAIDNARKQLDRVTHLASDAASEESRPTGMAHGELAARIQRNLEATIARGQAQRELGPEQGVLTPVHNDAIDHVLDIDQALLEERIPDPELEALLGGGAGPIGVGDPVHALSQVPRDAVNPPETSRADLPGLENRPFLRELVSKDEATQSQQAARDNSPVLLTIPNPDYPGSPAASPEERRAAGFPDREITQDDLKSRPEEVARLLNAVKSGAGGGVRHTPEVTVSPEPS